MIAGRKCQFCALSGIMTLIIFLVNVYFLHVISSERQDVGDTSQRYNKKHNGTFLYRNKKLYFVIEQLKKQLKRKSNHNNNDSKELWSFTTKWNQNGVVYNPLDSNFGAVLQGLRSFKVIQAENSHKGTQFKLSLTLEGNRTVFFKPQWYKRNHIVKGGVYSGKDRHTAEVAAFYFSLLLDIRWVPVAVMRKLNIKRDIWNVATQPTRDTMLVQDNNICMYGKCLYCRANETVCGDSKGEVEGAVILLLDGPLRKYRSPWQRTYSQHKTAEWENNDNYCSGVKRQLPLTRILDLVDASVLDFLLQNGDRHHYETFVDRIVYLDNGKGLGNPHKDYMDILAPLYQCCVIRTSTWERLKLFSNGSLSASFAALTTDEIGSPLVTSEHLKAFDRRLSVIHSTVEECVVKRGKFIFKDGK